MLVGVRPLGGVGRFAGLRLESVSSRARKPARCSWDSGTN